MKKCPSCSEELSWETEFCPGCGAETDYFMQPAGFWIRVAASLLDGVVFIPLIALTFVNLFYWQNFVIAVAIAIPGFIYKPFMESQFGATVGKMICKIRVLNDDGAKLSFGKAYVRFIPNFFSATTELIKTIILFALIDLSSGGTYLEIIQKAAQEPTFSVVNLLSNIIGLFILIDCLFVAFTERKRAIHDMMAGSYCVYKPLAEKMQAMADRAGREGGQPQEYSDYFKTDKDTEGE